MKGKFRLISFIALFVVVRAASASVSHSELINSDDLDAFCKYQGVLGSLAETNEEFKMLLEPPNYPNFQSMYAIVSLLLERVSASEKHLNILKNPECNVSKYTRGLLAYYEGNKAEIAENIKNKGQERDIVSVFESLKKKVGTAFLSYITLDEQRTQIHKDCPTLFLDKKDLSVQQLQQLVQQLQLRNQQRQLSVQEQQELQELQQLQQLKQQEGAAFYQGKTTTQDISKCHDTTTLTLMKLIDTVQMLTEELDKLKLQTHSSSSTERVTSEL